MRQPTASAFSQHPPPHRKIAALTMGTLLLLPGLVLAAPSTAEFQQWQSQQKAQYQSWLSAQDQAFAESLRKDWEAFLLQQPEVRDAAPKPLTPPVAPSPAPPLIAPVPVTVPTTPAPATPPVLPLVVLPAAVPAQVPVPAKLPADSKRYTLNTLGKPVTVDIKSGLLATFTFTPSASSLAGHFEKLAGIQGTPALVDALTKVSREHRLNHWSHLLLLNELARQLHPADLRSRRLLLWFLALKSGVDARLGYNGDDVFLLLPFTTTVYGYNYFTLEDKRYYVIDPGQPTAISPGTVSTYRQAYNSPQVVDLHVVDAMQISGPAPRTRQLILLEGGQTYRYSFTLDPALVRLYDSVPITDLDVYFASAWTGTLREQLHAQLAPQLKGKSERDAINFLLHFVQKTLEYKTDKDQFQRENYLFPDQTLFYPYSDCEDRSILFAALVRDLLGLPVLGLSYPGHVATAVLIASNEKEDTIEWQGRRYVVADPTYIGADAGMAMPGMTAKAAKVIDFSAAKTNTAARN